MLRILITLLFLPLVGFTFFQDNSTKEAKPNRIKLFYFVNGSGSDYMIPYIEEVLRRMKDSKYQESIFSSIVSLRALHQTTDLVASLLDESRNKTDSISWPLKIPYVEIKEYILKNDKILNININVLSDLIEYQFTLYNIDKKIDDTSLYYVKNSSIFVNPKKENYKNEILTALKYLFPNANYRPTVKVMVNNNLPLCDNLIYNEFDTVKVNTIVYDKDSREEDINYHWDTALNNNILNIERTADSQILFGLKVGQYKLFYFIDDGIDSTKTDSLILTIVKRPDLKVQNKNLFSANTIMVIFQSYFRKKNYLLLNNPLLTFSVDTFPFPLNCHTSGLVLNLEVFSKKEISTYKDTSLIPSKLKSLHSPDSSFSIKQSKMSSLHELKAGQYNIRFMLKKGSLRSSLVSKDLHIYKRGVVSYYQDYMFQPFARSSILNSYYNISGGLNAKLWRGISITGSCGFNVRNGLANRLYGCIDFNYESNYSTIPFECGYSTLIYKRSGDNAPSGAYGTKISIPLTLQKLAGVHCGLGIYYAPSPYQGNSNLLVSLFCSVRFYSDKK